jgi:hypothetical protein
MDAVFVELFTIGFLLNPSLLEYVGAVIASTFPRTVP